jgi:hypothetical protein
MMGMPRTARSFLTIAVAAAGMWTGGCMESKPLQPVEKLPDHVQMMIGPNAKLVKQGKPPLQFKAGREGSLSIVDMTAGVMNSYAMVSVPGSVVIIDPSENGIRIRNPKQPHVREMLQTPAPINPEHVYGIYYAPSR